MIPESYEQWVHCITVRCRIALSAEYVAERLSVLRNTHHSQTRDFRRLYGDEHWKRVIGWFEKSELQAAK
ncbi:MAG: hypothetical protein ACR2NZ_02990 [Rubripirellula sp.]